MTGGWYVLVGDRVVAWAELEGDARAIAHRRGLTARVERVT